MLRSLPRVTRVRSFAFVLTAIAFGACGDDSSSTEPEAQPDPPRLSLGTIDTVPSSALAPDESGAPSFPDPLPLPCGGAIVVELALERYELRAPGSCGATPRCGHVLVRATHSGTGASIAARVITPRAFLQLSPPASFDGLTTFDAQLVLDDGSPFETADGDPIIATPASANFRFTDTCGPVPSEGGAGGAPGGAGGEGGGEATPIAGAGGASGGGGETGESGASSAGEGGSSGGNGDAGAGGETAGGVGGDAAASGQAGVGGSL